jgi:hypothetical protein
MNTMGGTMGSTNSGGGVGEIDGGSGSTTKKMSKKEKLKNFFMKHTH